jgi:hypothetical protein
VGPGVRVETGPVQLAPTRTSSPQVDTTATPSGDGQRLVIPTADGGTVELHEPTKTVGQGEDQRELRQLTPEERARRRFRRNLIMWVVGTLVLIGTLAFLLNM